MIRAKPEKQDLVASSCCVVALRSNVGSLDQLLRMHYVGYAELAAAVSNAGGLGILALHLTARSADCLRASCMQTRIITALTVAQPPRGKEALRDEIRT